MMTGQVDIVQSEIVKNADGNQDPDGRRTIVDQRCALRRRRRPAAVFTFVLTQLLDASGEVSRRNQQLPAETAPFCTPGDVAGFQNQRPVVQLPSRQGGDGKTLQS